MNESLEEILAALTRINEAHWHRDDPIEAAQLAPLRDLRRKIDALVTRGSDGMELMELEREYGQMERDLWNRFGIKY
jgi:hypothetical protein